LEAVKISILVPDLSGNCLSRSYLLAKILQRRFEVELIGPASEAGLWPPLAGDRSLTYKVVPSAGRLGPYRDLLELRRHISGQLVYASKPLLTSLGVGLLAKLRDHKPLILDMDDWELGLARTGLDSLTAASRIRHLLASTVFLYRQSSYWNILVSDLLIRYADDITVASTFLQERYGGTVVRHARNTHELDPARFDAGSVRKGLGIGPGSRVVMFAGTPRPHKGLEDLVDAVSMLQDRNVQLVVIGLSDRDPYCKGLVKSTRDRLGPRFTPVGLQPFSRMPELLVAADVFAVPQRQSPAALGQVPMKVFDAMAMARPIIATCIGDIPEVLSDCGWVVRPGDVGRMAECIAYVLSHPEDASRMGRRARDKCAAQYSWDAVEGLLASVIERHL
jgi:glycosyltransferase involved in cell wall biosynthesis